MDSVALVHGWGGSFATTWQRSGLTDLLQDAGKNVIGVDLLGHGDAPKPHDDDAYSDLTGRLFDAIDHESPDQPVEAIGFSLGALTLVRAAIARPDRFSRLVLAGIGKNVFERDDSATQAIVAGLERATAGGTQFVEDEGAETDENANVTRLFVQYAQQPGNDIVALTSVLRRPRSEPIDPGQLDRIACPVLIVVGDKDFVHPGDALAAAFPDGRCVTLPNVDHFATTEAFGFFDAALEFLDAF